MLNHSLPLNILFDLSWDIFPCLGLSFVKWNSFCSKCPYCLKSTNVLVNRWSDGKCAKNSSIIRAVNLFWVLFCYSSKAVSKCSTSCYNTYSSGKGTVPILISLFLYLHKWIMVQLIFTGTISTWLFWCFLTLGSLLTFMFIAGMRSLSGSDIKSEINIWDSNQYVHTELMSGNLWILCIQKNSRFSYK